MSSAPPFKLASSSVYTTHRDHQANSLLTQALSRVSEAEVEPDESRVNGRVRLGSLASHFHCSIIGTCLTTQTLRKTIGRFIDVTGQSDAVLHHEAVGRVSEDPAVARAIGKTLDRVHEAAVARFDRHRDVRSIEAEWEECLQRGEIPGAYWAALTHRLTTPDLQKRVFGDVHMLSHLVGAANRADIRRLMALQGDNDNLRAQMERQSERLKGLLQERDAALEDARWQAEKAQRILPAPSAQGPDLELVALAAQVGLQTARREHAEQIAAGATADAERLRAELERLRTDFAAVASELSAVEAHLLRHDDASATSPLTQSLRGQRLLYVGGRPSTTAAIRKLVVEGGGEFRKHDGGLEDRKGLLDTSVAWASLVVFPVDCIDHDSALRLKRICTRLGTRFVPLRSAGVASFAAGVAGRTDTGGEAPPFCRRHA